MTHNHGNCHTMACPRYCAEWIADWRATHPNTFRRRLTRTYEEQSANLEASRHYGSWLYSNGLTIETYEQSVKMLADTLYDMTYPG